MTETEKRDKYKGEKENRRTNLAYLRLLLKLFHLHSLLFVELLPLARLLSTELDSLPGKDEKIMVVIGHLCPHILKSGKFSQNVLKMLVSTGFQVSHSFYLSKCYPFVRCKDKDEWKSS